MKNSYLSMVLTKVLLMPSSLAFILFEPKFDQWNKQNKQTTHETKVPLRKPQKLQLHNKNNNNSDSGDDDDDDAEEQRNFHFVPCHFNNAKHFSHRKSWWQQNIFRILSNRSFYTNPFWWERWKFASECSLWFLIKKVSTLEIQNVQMIWVRELL